MSGMDEQQSTPQHANGAPREPAGVILRREREQQGLSIEDVALQLNLRPIVVAGLEEDRFEEVPVAAYRRGYMRAYARFLGIDDIAVVNAYDATHGRSDIDRKLATVNTSRQPSRVGPWVFRLFTLLVIVGLISLTLLWWQSREGNDVLGVGGDDPIAVDSRNGGDQNATTPSDDLTPRPDSGDTALPPMPTSENTPQAGDTASTAANSTGVSASAETTVPDGDALEAEQVADSANLTQDEASNTQETAPNVDDTTLSLTFAGESWTQIFDATGDQVFSSLQPAGSEATVTGEPPFRLTIGQSSDVTLTYRGEQVDLAQYTSGNVARFTLGD